MDWWPGAGRNSRRQIAPDPKATLSFGSTARQLQPGPTAGSPRADRLVQPASSCPRRWTRAHRLPAVGSTWLSSLTRLGPVAGMTTLSKVRADETGRTYLRPVSGTWIPLRERFRHAPVGACFQRRLSMRNFHVSIRTAAEATLNVLVVRVYIFISDSRGLGENRRNCKPSKTSQTHLCLAGNACFSERPTRRRRTADERWLILLPQPVPRTEMLRGH